MSVLLICFGEGRGDLLFIENMGPTHFYLLTAVSLPGFFQGSSCIKGLEILRIEGREERRKW